MIKLARFLKPFLPGLILAMSLLFTQAISELFLPNLMGDIVNIGIQQGGIEEASPRILSTDAMDFLKAFMDKTDQSVFENGYDLVSGDSLDKTGKPYSDTWPTAAGQDVYVLRALDTKTQAQIDDIFGTTTWTMLKLMQHIQSALEESGGVMGGSDLSGGFMGGAPLGDKPSETAAPEASSNNPTNPDIQEFNMSRVYGLLPMIKMLPPEWMDQARADARALDPSMRGQSGTMLIQAFYRELGADMTGFEMSYITRIGLIMLAVTTVTGISTILVGYLSARIGAGVARNLRSVVFNKVATFSHAEFDRFSTASLITRSTNDVMMMQMIVSMGIRMVCYAPIMGIGGAIMAINKSVSMSWIVVVAVVVMLGGVTLQMSIVTPKFRLVQKLTDRLNLVAREKLSGLMVIRAFNRDDVERERFDDANINLTNTHIFIGRVMAFMGPFMTIIMNGMSILIIWVGGHYVAESQMQVGDMMAYIQYIMHVMFSFMMVSMMFIMLPRAQVSAGRIVEVLDTDPSIVDPDEPRSIESDKRGSVEFKNVNFRYEGAEEDALSNINFTALPGQTIAFTGPTGSGKSSILNLIPRFYDVADGEILVDGVDVRDLTQTELRSHIGYVPQKSLLMGGTIASNIAYGVQDGELTEAELIEYATIAQARDFIEEKEEGFDFPIAQGGYNVSGGQRQRLSIARALAVKPDIFLFDDSFSALDFTTDAALRRALRDYTSDSTLLVVSQRIGTIMDADVIHVVDEGRIVGSGSHADLLVSCPAYYDIASSQLAEVELGIGRGPLSGVGTGLDRSSQHNESNLSRSSLTEGGES